MNRGEPTGVVFNVMRFATHDGPGIRTSIFFKGCPLACWWCHNPESQSFHPELLYSRDRCRLCLDCAAACPQHAIRERAGSLHTSSACTRCGHCADVCLAEARNLAGRRYSVAGLLDEVERDRIFFDDSAGGVTLTGGEPVSQPAFAAAILDACRERGLGTALETCGFAPPAVFRNVALRADLVLFDLKFVDPEKHRRYTGAANDWILNNLADLLSRGRPVTVRIPVVPRVNDSEEDIRQFAECLGRLRPHCVELLPYHTAGTDKYRRLGRSYRLARTRPPAAADLAPLREALVAAGLQVKTGGGV